MRGKAEGSEGFHWHRTERVTPRRYPRIAARKRAAILRATSCKGSLPSDGPSQLEQFQESEWSVDTPVEEREIENAIEALPEGARNVLLLSAVGYSHPERPSFSASRRAPAKLSFTAPGASCANVS